MCLELVNINLGFQESIHSMSLKQGSLCLSLPLPYCCCTFFDFFLTRQGISNNTSSCHMFFYATAVKVIFCSWSLWWDVFLLVLTTIKYECLLWNAEKYLFQFFVVPGQTCETSICVVKYPMLTAKNVPIGLQKSHSQALIDLTGTSYCMFLITEMSLYWLYHPHIRGFFQLSVFIYYFQFFFNSEFLIYLSKA